MDTDTQVTRETDNKENHEIFDSILTELLPDIEELVPDEDFKTKGCLFPLARIAKTIDERIGHPLSVTCLEKIFDQWYEYCQLAEISTHTGDPSDYFAEFVAIYGSTRVPHNEGIMERALMAAAKSQSPPGIEKLPKSNKDILLIASLCYQLHLLNPEGFFYLGVRKVETLIPHLKRQKINNIIRYLCKCNFIEIIKKGTLKDRQASEFKFVSIDKCR